MAEPPTSISFSISKLDSDVILDFLLPEKYGQKPEVLQVEDPPRLVIDFLGLRVKRGLKYELNGGPIKHIRVGSHPLKTRFVLDLDEKLESVPVVLFDGNDKVVIQFSIKNQNEKGDQVNSIDFSSEAIAISIVGSNDQKKAKESRKNVGLTKTQATDGVATNLQCLDSRGTLNTFLPLKTLDMFGLNTPILSNLTTDSMQLVSESDTDSLFCGTLNELTINTDDDSQNLTNSIRASKSALPTQVALSKSSDGNMPPALTASKVHRSLVTVSEISLSTKAAPLTLELSPISISDIESHTPPAEDRILQPEASKRIIDVDASMIAGINSGLDSNARARLAVDQPSNGAIAPLESLNLISQIEFAQLPKIDLPILRVVGSKRPEFTFSLESQGNYKLTLPAADFGGEHLLLPRFAPAQFKGLLAVNPTRENNLVVLNILVEPGTKLSASTHKFEIWINSL